MAEFQSQTSLSGLNCNCCHTNAAQQFSCRKSLPQCDVQAAASAADSCDGRQRRLDSTQHVHEGTARNGGVGTVGRAGKRSWQRGDDQNGCRAHHSEGIAPTQAAATLSIKQQHSHHRQYNHTRQQHQQHQHNHPTIAANTAAAATTPAAARGRCQHRHHHRRRPPLPPPLPPAPATIPANLATTTAAAMATTHVAVHV